MESAIGMAEFKSIVIGIEIADKMIKAANVNVLMARPVCPGKFLVLLSGEVEDIKESINLAAKIFPDSLMDHFIIPNVHPAIKNAFKNKPDKVQHKAIGAMEFSRTSSGIKALDFALKNADVELIKLNIGNGISGKCYFILAGDISAINEALNAAEINTKGSKLLHRTSIPNPPEELIKNLI